MATKVDWEGLEVHYRSGVKSLKEIGLEFGVSPPAIVKHAKKHSWTRDLSKKIQAKADAKVNAAQVNATVNAAKAVNDAMVIEVNAEIQFQVRMSHRNDIKRVKQLLLALLAEAEHQAANVVLYQDLGVALRSPDENGYDKLNEIYKKALSLPSRVGVLKQIVETLALLIKLEREAFGIDGKEEKESEIDVLLKKIKDEHDAR